MTEKDAQQYPQKTSSLSATNMLRFQKIKNKKISELFFYLGDYIDYFIHEERQIFQQLSKETFKFAKSDPFSANGCE